MFYEKALAFAQIQCQSLTTKALQTFQNQLTEAYRQKLSTSALKSAQAMAIYAAARMPATYHAVQSCYQHLPADFHPQSLLDLGAGPGTASLAALDYWPSLRRLTLVENHRLMYDFQRALWEHLNPGPSYQPIHDSVDSLQKLLDEGFDIVVLAYVLGELKAGQQQDAILKAWQKTMKYFLIVTPGTPHDFEYLLRVRDELLGKGAVIVAPCPHQDRCPLTETWRLH
ncbi:small ribosomal subunit Rsm22 family protein [Candidatus Finniella inopinata]|uniref:Methyltransferase n=1 Tax=Candidatus Finniella inopinata TaxID=1696036 RepID=A0A4Q7DFQ9_9PROT|nr:small ribosomal subunit Rsm22 family protein [Candidatus Finniella inopinata]RZI45641.1 hypothetical protein EQU50_05940 [Candidatus Finniella inopinata]